MSDNPTTDVHYPTLAEAFEAGVVTIGSTLAVHGGKHTCCKCCYVEQIKENDPVTFKVEHIELGVASGFPITHAVCSHCGKVRTWVTVRVDGMAVCAGCN